MLGGEPPTLRNAALRQDDDEPSPRALPLLSRRTEPATGENWRVASLSPQGEFATWPAGRKRREGTGEAGGTAGAFS